MLASRPSTSSARAGSGENATAVPEEKRIPGVRADTLREERKPLLDLEDVELLESELAACFDAPPPPPLSIHQQQSTATISSWTPSLEPRYLENQHVPPPVTSEETSAVSAPVTTSIDAQERREHEAHQATRVSDLSNLYLPAPEREPSSRQLYPALIPTAPSSEATRRSATSGAERRTEAARAQPATMPSSAVMLDDMATSGVTTAAAGLSALAAVRSQRGMASRAAAGESSVEVVEELLSENERLRFIVQEMSDELDRVSRQLQNREKRAQESGVSVGPTEAAVASSQTQQRGTSSAPSLAPSRSQMAQYPGAAAEASRRRREQEAEQNRQRQQQQQQQQQQPSLRRGVFVHFKCENCPQWLKVPEHALLVFCPTCSHTSQMTANSTIHYPPNNGATASSSRSIESPSVGASSGQDQTSWTEYFKRLIPS